ncbi:hypothetical protein GALMADRAFT_242961 [Galerina marginata CBS 339.88]|uniref:RING-type domain-containing protein n=1 Tax=Galerina marginata (strain CBS 339.88) TaxID=685588 RepID=A0A067T7D5_GALM3|nr:hypothetical protein GALMADRAFT_242961 [Galerina marginata CBS 339.88]
MHYSKTYAQLLQGLPPELRDNAIQYRQLKKIINQIVDELSSYGLKPEFLHELIESSKAGALQHTGALHDDPSSSSTHSSEDERLSTPIFTHTHPRAVYELDSTSGKIVPLLHIYNIPPTGVVPAPKQSPIVCEGPDASRSSDGVDLDVEHAEHPESVGASGHTTLLRSFKDLQFGSDGSESGSVVEVEAVVKSVPHFGGESSGTEFEEVIHLRHDTEFYGVLSTTLEAISAHLTKVYADFVATLEELSKTISDTAHPASVAARFHPLSSVNGHAGAVRVKTGHLKNDLYFWREIFQLYLEAEVFESVGETTRGERTVEESEKRLQLFAQRAHQQGHGDHNKFKLQQSRDALETFLNLNLFILNVKKFSHANSEATRKILKKHAKRTALFFPGLQVGGALPADQPLLALVSHSTPFAFPRMLVQAVGETLLPIIPSVEDYSCLICTSIAFKPIRLSCGHLFCVRCLVKMQKRNQGDCPMCRTPSVLVANGNNVDWALLNFMQDWFPIESKEKLKSNEKEATEEQMRELGLDPNQSCVLM